MMSAQNNKAIVIDSGSCFIKAGFAECEKPKCVFRSMIGEPHRDPGDGKNYQFIGEDAYGKRGILKLRCPVQRGHVTNWDDMQRVSCLFLIICFFQCSYETDLVPCNV